LASIAEQVLLSAENHGFAIFAEFNGNEQTVTWQKVKQRMQLMSISRRSVKPDGLLKTGFSL